MSASMAETWVDAHGLGDGSVWETSDGDEMLALLYDDPTASAVMVEIDEHDGPASYPGYAFPDGSAIWYCDAYWALLPDPADTYTGRVFWPQR